MSLSKTRIQEYEKELEKMRNIIPFEQMTIENLNDVFPETKLDKKQSPTGLTSQLRAYKLKSGRKLWPSNYKLWTLKMIT